MKFGVYAIQHSSRSVKKLAPKKSHDVWYAAKGTVPFLSTIATRRCQQNSGQFLCAIVVCISCFCWSASSWTSEIDRSYAAASESIALQGLQAHVEFLTSPTCDGREAGTAGGMAAAEYLCIELEKYGVQGAADGGGYEQIFAPHFRNIIGVIKGSDPNLNDQVVLICAHYDHVGHGAKENSRGPIGRIHPGADDNASGVAAVLEVAKMIKSLPRFPSRSIVLAFWDAEEEEMLGSTYWTEHPTIPLDQIAAAINVDMIGRLRDNQLTIYGSRTGFGLRRLLSEQNQSVDLKIEFSWEMEDDGDQYPLFRHEIPVLFLHTGVHDDYHSPRDTADKINYEGMRLVSQLLFHSVCALAECNQMPAFRLAVNGENEKMRGQFESSFNQLPARLGVLAEKNGYSAAGVRLTAVTNDSPAANAGVRPGDRIVRFANDEVHSDAELTSAVMHAESQSPIEVRRDNLQKPLRLHVQLDSKPMRLGITWRIDDAEPGTVVLTYVMPDSIAAKAGLIEGDRVYKVNGRDFDDQNAFQRLIQTTANAQKQFLIERDGQIHTVNIDSPTKNQ
jgi:hypothetical protein